MARYLALCILVASVTMALPAPKESSSREEVDSHPLDSKMTVDEDELSQVLSQLDEEQSKISELAQEREDAVASLDIGAKEFCNLVLHILRQSHGHTRSRRSSTHRHVQAGEMLMHASHLCTYVSERKERPRHTATAPTQPPFEEFIDGAKRFCHVVYEVRAELGESTSHNEQTLAYAHNVCKHLKPEKKVKAEAKAKPVAVTTSSQTTQAQQPASTTAAPRTSEPAASTSEDPTDASRMTAAQEELQTTTSLATTQQVQSTTQQTTLVTTTPTQVLEPTQQINSKSQNSVKDLLTGATEFCQQVNKQLRARFKRSTGEKGGAFLLHAASVCSHLPVLEHEIEEKRVAESPAVSGTGDIQDDAKRFCHLLQDLFSREATTKYHHYSHGLVPFLLRASGMCE